MYFFPLGGHWGSGQENSEAGSSDFQEFLTAWSCSLVLVFFLSGNIYLLILSCVRFLKAKWESRVSWDRGAHFDR